MREIWKEFFRLKREEISYWAKNVLPEKILLPILAVILICHCVISVLFMFLYVCGIQFDSMGEFWFAISSFPYICGFIIWVLYRLIDWLHSNWKQAVRNVEER
jgi:hypothetical protein